MFQLGNIWRQLRWIIMNCFQTQEFYNNNNVNWYLIEKYKFFSRQPARKYYFLFIQFYCTPSIYENLYRCRCKVTFSITIGGIIAHGDVSIQLLYGYCKIGF